MPVTARSGRLEYNDRRIPGAFFWDIDAVADTTSPLPHMLPDAAVFSAAVATLGIQHDRTCVVYDSTGVFSSPRVWWTLRTFGHRSVAILNGGLPRWTAEGYPVAGKDDTVTAESLAPVEKEEWVLNLAAVRNLTQVVGEVRKRQAENVVAPSSSDEQVVDARGVARFNGEVPEPRVGLRSGHIPFSRNVPFDTVLAGSPAPPPPPSPQTGSYTTFESPERIEEVFRVSGVDVNRPGTIVTSCGSGITACVLQAALALCGRPADHESGLSAVFDGSWAQYGAETEAAAPLETGRGGR